MFEIISILSSIVIFLILIKKLYNKIEKYEKNHSCHIDNIYDWQNKILTRLSNIDSLNIKLLEKDFNLISSFPRDDINTYLAKYDINNHVEDMIRFITHSRNYELNIIIIAHMYHKIRDEKFNINDKNLLNSFYEYGVMMSLLDDKTNSVFDMIKSILRRCNFNYKEKL